jgi:hypothetical protein
MLSRTVERAYVEEEVRGLHGGYERGFGCSRAPLPVRR